MTRPLGVLVALMALAPSAGAAGRSVPQPVASAWIGVLPAQEGSEAVLEVRASAATAWPDETNDYGNDGAFHEYNFIRITAAQAQELADGLEAWADEPHSDVVFQASSPDNKTGLGFSGLAVYKDRTNVVLARVSFWISPGRNGGVFIALAEADVRQLAAALRGWIANPTPGGGFIYVREAVTQPVMSGSAASSKVVE